MFKLSRHFLFILLFFAVDRASMASKGNEQAWLTMGAEADDARGIPALIADLSVRNHCLTFELLTQMPCHN